MCYFCGQHHRKECHAFYNGDFVIYVCTNCLTEKFGVELPSEEERDDQAS